MRFLLQFAALALGFAVSAAPAHAETYPDRPIQLIVPFAAGGSVDFVARQLAQELQKSFPKGVVVVNRAGASATIGTRAIATAAPDGYTIGLINIAHVSNPALGPVPYDPIKDFAPVSLATRIPSMLIVHQSFPANTVQELIAMAKAKPGALSYGSVGLGTSNHLPMELLLNMTGAKMLHVPYSSTGGLNADLLGGQVPIGFTTVPTGVARVKTGKVKALGVASPKRLAVLPDVPAIAETVPGFEFADWNAVVAPAGTPPEIVAHLHDAVVKAMGTPEFRRRMNEFGAEVVGSTPQELGEFLHAELLKWDKVIRAAGITKH